MGQTYAPPFDSTGLLGHRRRTIAAYDAPVTTRTSPAPRFVLPLRPATLRAMRDGAIAACVVLAAAHLLGLVDIGVDAYTYWTADPSSPYTSAAPGTAQAYFYSPAFAQLTAPIHLLPWQVFIAAWTVLLAAALVWQAGLWTAIALLLVPVFVDLTVGNIHILLGAAIMLGFRWPWTWAFVFLTKITPGVGVLWFAFRREWRKLAIALAATGLIAGASFLYAPNLWREWIDFIGSTPEGGSVAQFQIPIPLWLRLPAAFALVVWGALNDRRWTVPVAATFALPVLWVSGFAICAALASEPLRQTANPRVGSQDEPAVPLRGAGAPEPRPTD